jgi:hypothetical protein
MRKIENMDAATQADLPQPTINLSHHSFRENSNDTVHSDEMALQRRLPLSPPDEDRFTVTVASPSEVKYPAQTSSKNKSKRAKPIENASKEYLTNKSGSLTGLDVDVDETTVEGQDSEINGKLDNCPICNENAYGLMVNCNICGTAYHYQCSKLATNEIDDGEIICKCCGKDTVGGQKVSSSTLDSRDMPQLFKRSSSRRY